MRSKKKQADRTPATIYRSIKTNDPSTPPSPGSVGQAAVAAAARHQLYRYAQDIEDYLESAKLDALLNQLQTDMNYSKGNRHE
jgi:hypothetical protein